MSEQVPQTPETQETQERQETQKHYMMWVNNFVGSRKLGTVEYEDELQGQTWITKAQLNGTTIGQGQGKSKKEAHENAASKALDYLKSQHEG